VPRLLNLLRTAEADQAVRAAAVTRPLDDVVQLIGLLEDDEDEPAPEEPPPSQAAPVSRGLLRPAAALALAVCGASQLPRHVSATLRELVPLGAVALLLALACCVLAYGGVLVAAAAAVVSIGVGVAAYVPVHAFGHGVAPPTVQWAAAALGAALAVAVAVRPARR
jgi:hypothetical protein